MAVPKVDQRMLGELEAMGFPTVRAIRALHYSGNPHLHKSVQFGIFIGSCHDSAGNSSLEAAINWLLEHEGDPDIDQLPPPVPREIYIESGDQFLRPAEVQKRVQQTQDHARERKSEQMIETARSKRSQAEREVKEDEHNEEVRKRILELYKAKKDEEERERGRIRHQLQQDKRERMRAAKDLMEAKRTLEENQRKRMLESRKAEEEEEKKSREKIRQRIEDDKAERRRKFGMQEEVPGTSVAIVPHVIHKEPVKPSVRAEQLRDSLRHLKKNHKDDTVTVRRAFQTLLKIVVNIVRNPEEEKFRRIRLSNPVFQDRVGHLQGGVEFLELCGFQKLESNGYLVMPRSKVDMALLNGAAAEITSAMENPYFGLLSK